MSYSRWSNSRWYTYWSTYSGKTKDMQFLSICPYMDVSYSDIKNNIDTTLIKVKEAVITEGENEPSDIELQELKGYMMEFVKDVDKEIIII